MKLILKNSELHFDYMVIPDAIKPAINAYGNSISKEGKIGLVKLYNFMSANGYWNNMVKFYAPFITTDASKAFINIKDGNVDVDLSSKVDIDTNGIIDKDPVTVEKTRVLLPYTSTNQFNKSFILMADKQTATGFTNKGAGLSLVRSNGTSVFGVYNEYGNDVYVPLGTSGFTRYYATSQRNHVTLFSSFLPDGVENNLRSAVDTEHQDFTIRTVAHQISDFQIGIWNTMSISGTSYRVNFGRHLQVGMYFETALALSDYNKIQAYLYALDDYMMGVTDEFVDPVFS